MGSETLACIWFFSKLPLRLFGEAKGFNSAEPAHRSNFDAVPPPQQFQEQHNNQKKFTE
jgi:hypothetical protein